MNKKQKEIYLLNSLESKYCLFVLTISLFVGYYFIPPHVFHTSYAVFAFVFMFFFALTTMCIVRNIKEKIILARTYKSSLFSILAIVLGLGALQVCGVGAPVCGATVGLGVLSFFFPTIFSHLPKIFAVYLIVGSIFLQILSLYFMNCFKKTYKK